MNWSDMFFQGWSGIVRTIIVGTLAYAFLVVSLRLAGNRTLAKLNAFDLVITVAFGSTLASILLSEGIALAEGGTALMLLIGLQFSVAYLSVRSKAFAKAVRAEPMLLVRNGEALPQAMHRARVTRAELEAVIRTEGCGGIEEVAAAVLESDGSFSVIASGRTSPAETALPRIG